jgi:hypothetical protein
LDHCSRQCIGRCYLEIEAANGRVRFSETTLLIGLTAIDLDLALPAYDFIDDAGDRADRALDALTDAPA